MQFYLFSSKYPQFGKDEIHLFHNSLDADKLLKSSHYAGHEYRYKCATSLIELIFFATPKDDFLFSQVEEYEDYIECCKTTFKQLCLKFGVEAIREAFPDDKFDTQMLNELRTKIDIYLKDLADDWRKSELDDSYSYYNPEIDAAEDEMRRWDDEDPSWRIANDLD